MFVSTGDQRLAGDWALARSTVSRVGFHCWTRFSKGSLSGSRLPADHSTLDSRVGFQSTDPGFMIVRPILEDFNSFAVRTLEIVTNLLNDDIEVPFDV